MTGDLYKDVDEPFCVTCSRFMMIHIGIIWVALNHESDIGYIVRHGDAFKCPQCGHIIIQNLGEVRNWAHYDLKNLPYWYIFLEDHTHYNKKKAKK